MADTPTSVLDTITNALKGFVNFDAETTAKILGVWTAARAAVQTVASGVAAAATQDAVDTAMAKYLPTKLTPAVLADMAVRNILGSKAGSPTPPRLAGIDGNDIYTEAGYAGLKSDRMDALILDTGESYGILDALRLWNRQGVIEGFGANTDVQPGQPLYSANADLSADYAIQTPELDKVIYYSRVRDEFIADLKKLARNPVSPADAVEMAVKQVLNEGDALNAYVAAGGIPEQFDAVVAAAGDSAGIEHAMEVFNHGLISAAQLRQILAMSRINPRFYYLYDPRGTDPPLMSLRWLPPYEIKEAVAADPSLAPMALKWMLDQGYPPDQAAAFAKSLSTAAVAKPKEESVSMVLEEYQAHMLTDPQAVAALTALGYAPAAIPFLMNYAQAKAVISARNVAVTRVREGYLLSLITEDAARNELSQIGVPASAIPELLADWTAERAVPHTALTVAEIGWFVEHAVIPLSQGETLWKMRGLTDADVALMAHRYPPPAPAPPAVPAGSGGM